MVIVISVDIIVVGLRFNILVLSYLIGEKQLAYTFEHYYERKAQNQKI